MGRRVKKIDNLIWDLHTSASLALAAGSVGVAFVGVGTQPATLLRMRGEILYWVDGTQAPGGAIQVFSGIVKVPEGSGTDVAYDPFNDGNAPWIWFSCISLGYEEMVTDVVAVQGAQFARVGIDNKAMRRIRPDEELQLVHRNVTTGTAMAVNISTTVRLLQGF